MVIVKKEKETVGLHAKKCRLYVGFLKFHKYGIHFSSLFIKFDFTFFLHQQLGEHSMSNMQFAPIDVSLVSQSPQSHSHPWQRLDAPGVHQHLIFQRNMLLCKMFFLLFFVSWPCFWFAVHRMPVNIVNFVNRSVISPTHLLLTWSILESHVTNSC